MGVCAILQIISVLMACIHCHLVKIPWEYDPNYLITDPLCPEVAGFVGQTIRGPFTDFFPFSFSFCFRYDGKSILLEVNSGLPDRYKFSCMP